MATRTKSSDANGSQMSSAAKSSARVAAKGSTSAGRAHDVESAADGTSDTTTSTEPATPDRNTRAATGGRRRTGSSGKNAQARPDAGTPESGDDLVELDINRCHVLAVFGMFEARTLIEMPTEMARKLFGSIPAAMRPDNIAAVERDIERIRELDSALAESALAATALQMAYEMTNPFNSATSKSMCARALLETMEQLRELTPDGEEEGDELDAILRRGDEAPLTIVK